LKAREALFFSRYEASRAGSLAIQPEHVLLGLVRAGQGLRGRIFERLPLTLDDARAEISAVEGEPVPGTVAIPFSDRTKQIFTAAADESNRLGHEPIGLAHLLLGVLRDDQSAAAIAMGRKGVHLDSVRDGIAALLDETPV
jgi:ATP-dependent Clp protease ATP-binding subunit ClpC